MERADLASVRAAVQRAHILQWEFIVCFLVEPTVLHAWVAEAKTRRRVVVARPLSPAK